MARWFLLSAALLCFACNRGPDLEPRTLRHGGIERTYHLLPSPGIPTGPRPLVVALHGGGGVAEKLDKTTGFLVSRHAAERGWHVVYPDGIEKGWNDGRSPTNAVARRRAQVDDVGYLAALIEHLAETGFADRRRVYMMGISNGGFMTQRFAIDRSDLIAAGAAVTAQIARDWSERRPRAPVSMLIMNGTADPLVPYAGGDVVVFETRRGAILSTADSVDWWGRHARCSGSRTTSILPDTDPKDETRVHTERWTGCGDGTEVMLYRVEGGGHTWPGGDQYLPEFMVGRVSRDIDGIAHIFEFFARHQR